MKPDYYVLGICTSTISKELKYDTLREAKKAFLSLMRKGVKIYSHCIYGKCFKDEDISLTYTPYYSDTQTFGRTLTTMYGDLIKQGKYTF